MSGSGIFTPWINNATRPPSCRSRNEVSGRIAGCRCQCVYQCHLGGSGEQGPRPLYGRIDQCYGAPPPPPAAPRSAWGRTNHTVPITNRHDSPWFESFRSHFALFWSFAIWLAISEPGLTSRKKVTLRVRLKITRRCVESAAFPIKRFVKTTNILRLLGCTCLLRSGFTSTRRA